ncbi:unnamed protein product [Vitrella brassicaformis CCMP3155]|uniref:RRM domain-containing protein n=1 Tax=Vitrella brassicaformis (strain CCMP3155) TaxID=1169540 RepID=A0A0G4GIW9_VITBC|nr:unnamed protein product [Vitrella brassicaformis CCMP3155]|eukprot:CEM29781.1 unnamed protein product [Vitrella brassicaformis CCMP3155]
MIMMNGRGMRGDRDRERDFMREPPPPYAYHPEGRRYADERDRPPPRDFDRDGPPLYPPYHHHMNGGREGLRERDRDRERERMRYHSDDSRSDRRPTPNPLHNGDRRRDRSPSAPPRDSDRPLPREPPLRRPDYINHHHSPRSPPIIRDIDRERAMRERPPLPDSPPLRGIGGGPRYRERFGAPPQGDANSLYISGLPNNFTAEQVFERIFHGDDDIEKILVPQSSSKALTPFCFVEFKSYEAAKDVLDAYYSEEVCVDGKQVFMQWAKKRTGAAEGGWVPPGRRAPPKQQDNRSSSRRPPSK